MNNYPSSSYLKHSVSAYRDDDRCDFRSNRFPGLQDRGRAFYEHNLQYSSAVGQREPPYMNMHRPMALEENSVRRHMLQKYDEQQIQSRNIQESAHYERRRDNFADIGLSSHSESDALKQDRASFSNSSHLHSSPRSYSYGNSSTAFPTSRLNDTVPLNSYGINRPSSDLTLREKFQKHMQNEFQHVVEENYLQRRSTSSYQNNFSHSRQGGVLEEDRLYSDLPIPKNSQQSFDRDFKDFDDRVDHFNITARNDEEESRSGLGSRSLYPAINSEQRSEESYDECAGLHASSSPYPSDRYNQMKVNVASERNSNIFSRNESFKSLDPAILDGDRQIYTEESLINTEKHKIVIKDSRAFEYDTQKRISSANQSVFETHSQIPEKNIDRSHNFSGESYDDYKDLHASSSQYTSDRFNQMKVTRASEQNSNIFSKKESSKSDPGILENDVLMYTEDPSISSEEHKTDIEDSRAFQFDIQKRISSANQSVFETNSQIPEKQKERSPTFSTEHSYGFKNKNDMQTKSGNFFPENSTLPEVSDPPENTSNFLSKNSGSKDGSVKSFNEDSLHKVLEIATRANSCDNSLSTDDWQSSNSIPFLGETDDATTSNAISLESKLTEALSTQIQGKSEYDDSILYSTSLNKSDGNDKAKSALEDALETLMVKGPVVGLDYITEYKDIVPIDGGFAFNCKLCMSSISRNLIIDHIQGFKHRLKYLKLKDKISCEYIVNHLAQQSEKDEYVYKACEQLEKTNGRGSVVLESSDGKKPFQIRFGKVANNSLCSSDINQEDDITSEPFTIKKIDESSCNADSVENDLYGDHHSSNSISSDPTHKKEIDDGADNAILASASNKESTEVSFQEKSSEPEVTEHTTNEKLDEPDDDLSANRLNPSPTAEALRRPPSPSWYGQSKKFKHEASSDLKVPDTGPILLSNKNSTDKSKSIETTSQQHVFNPLVFEQLSKCDISTEEEANIVLKAISVLTKLLLSYKLQHIASEDLENLMTSVHNKPENIDKLLHLVKDKRYVTMEMGMDNSRKLRLDSDFSVKPEKSLESNPCDSLDALQGAILKQNHVETVKFPHSVEENTSGPRTSNSVENLNLPTSPAQKLSCNNASEINSLSKSVPNSANATWLQPLPFFQWSDPSTVPTTSSVPTAASGSQLQNNGMAWSSSYQMSVAAMQHYQRHGYGTSSAMFQGFPVPVPQCMQVTSIDSSFLQPASSLPIPLLPTNSISKPLPLPPGNLPQPPLPPTGSISKPPPLPPVNLPKPPLPPTNSISKPPPLPPSSNLPKPPLPPTSSISKPPLPPGSTLPKPPLPPTSSISKPPLPPSSNLPKPPLLPSIRTASPSLIGEDAKHFASTSLQHPHAPLLRRPFQHP